MSSPMLHEARRAIIADRQGIKPRDVNHAFRDIWDAFPEAHLLESDVEEAASQLNEVEPRSRDYYLLAAAVAGQVDSIVAIDRRRVSKDMCSDLGIAVLSLDMLFCACWKHNEFGVMQIFLEQAVERDYDLNEMFHHFIFPMHFYAPEFVERVLGIYAPPSLTNPRHTLQSLGLDDHNTRNGNG